MVSMLGRILVISLKLPLRSISSRNVTQGFFRANANFLLVFNPSSLVSINVLGSWDLVSLFLSCNLVVSWRIFIHTIFVIFVHYGYMLNVCILWLYVKCMYIMAICQMYVYYGYM